MTDNTETEPFLRDTTECVQRPTRLTAQFVYNRMFNAWAFSPLGGPTPTFTKGRTS